MEPLPTYHQAVRWKDRASARRAKPWSQVLAELGRRYRWTRQQAEAFVSRGGAPSCRCSRRQWSAPSQVIRTTLLRAPTRTRSLYLRCRPQATKKEVAEAYDRLSAPNLQASGIQAGQRNPLMSSPRTRNSAVLGYRNLPPRTSRRCWRPSPRMRPSTETPPQVPRQVERQSLESAHSARRWSRLRRATGRDLVWRPGLQQPRE